MSNPADPLTNDPIALQAMLAAERAENERLRQIIKELQRHRFGRRAESLPVDQLLLGLEEAEQVEAEGFAAEDAADPAKREARTRKRRANRGALRRALGDDRLTHRNLQAQRRRPARLPRRRHHPHRRRTPTEQARRPAAMGLCPSATQGSGLRTAVTLEPSEVIVIHRCRLIVQVLWNTSGFS